MIPIVSNTMEYSFSHAGNRKAVRPLLPSVVANECSCDLKSSLPNELLSERYIKKSVWRSINIMPCFVAHTKDGESFLEYPNQIPVTRDDIAMLPELISRKISCGEQRAIRKLPLTALAYIMRKYVQKGNSLRSRPCTKLKNKGRLVTAALFPAQRPKRLVELESPAPMISL